MKMRLTILSVVVLALGYQINVLKKTAKQVIYLCFAANS